MDRLVYMTFFYLIKKGVVQGCPPSLGMKEEGKG